MATIPMRAGTPNVVGFSEKLKPFPPGSQVNDQPTTDSVESTTRGCTSPHVAQWPVCASGWNELGSNVLSHDGQVTGTGGS
jgi:hypothetical protein